MPLHKAQKRLSQTKAAFYGIDPKEFLSKREYFIFDLLLFTTKAQVFVAERKSCFSPLKNCEGGESPQTVQRALQERDREVFTQITGKEPPEKVHFELSLEFYYPTEVLKKWWEARELPHAGYISSEE